MNPFAAGVDAWIKPEWPAPKCVHAFATTRQLPGNSLPPYDALNLGLRSGEDEAIVRANRALLERALMLPSPPFWLRQVHGTRAIAAEESSVEPEADAAFTSQRGVVLAIQTADCLPILLCAEDGSEIAAIHAGWRGLAADVVGACVRKLRSPPARLLAWLGPAIGPKSYEVGDDVRNAFIDRDGGAANAFAATRPGHWFCDLYTLAQRKLASLGVERVYGGTFDTFSDARFYSYRRDGARSGRLASLIWIDP